jgi:hypothetical protein
MSDIGTVCRGVAPLLFSQVRDLLTRHIALQMLASESEETHRIANARERGELTANSF